MKKASIFVLFFWAATIFAGVAEDDGKKSVDGKFVPVQLTWGVAETPGVTANENDTALSLGLLFLEQNSSVLSFAGWKNLQENNYGVQTGLIAAGSRCNYAVVCAPVAVVNKNYGVQISLLGMTGEMECLQLLGVNIADEIQIGLINSAGHKVFGETTLDERFLQIGLINEGGRFQIGLLNYNPRSWIPYLPLFNCNMGRPSIEEE
ncbi:MAG: hypothetical protein J6S43_01280 [Lentisphaeria bacterium]|nr:hypothetical protein [Lentisphaeria bacterium]